MVQQIDAPLREDVRLLGNLLGETLKQHAGQELFNQIEQIRALAKGARDGQAEAEKQLEQLFLELPDEELLPLTRAFLTSSILPILLSNIMWYVAADRQSLIRMQTPRIPLFTYLKSLKIKIFRRKNCSSKFVILRLNWYLRRIQQK